VVGEGRGAELAEPAEEGRGRSLDRDAPEVGRVKVPGEMIAGEVELLLAGRDAPVSSQWAHGREHTARGERPFQRAGLVVEIAATQYTARPLERHAKIQV